MVVLLSAEGYKSGYKERTRLGGFAKRPSDVNAIQR